MVRPLSGKLRVFQSEKYCKNNASTLNNTKSNTTQVCASIIHRSKHELSTYQYLRRRLSINDIPTYDDDPVEFISPTVGREEQDSVLDTDVSIVATAKMQRSGEEY